MYGFGCVAFSPVIAIENESDLIFVTDSRIPNDYRSVYFVTVGVGLDGLLGCCIDILQRHREILNTIVRTSEYTINQPLGLFDSGMDGDASAG